MQHTITITIDQSDDDPEDRIADAAEMAKYINEAMDIESRVKGRNKRYVVIGGMAFTVAGDIQVTEVPS